jgi:hypothetical protein
MTNPFQRIATVCFLMIDGAATLITMIHSSLTAVVILLAVTTSALLALLSSTINSILWPTYFWDESDSRAIAVRESDRRPPLTTRPQTLRRE